MHDHSRVKSCHQAICTLARVLWDSAADLGARLSAFLDFFKAFAGFGNTSASGQPTESGQNISDIRYRNFDYLRLFLSLEVVAMHLNAGLQTPRAFWIPIPPVPAFIALSGFLIPQALDRSKSIGYFGWNRALRTLPALVPLMIAISVVFGLSATEGALLQYVSAGYLGQFQGVILPLWSLIVEDWLYAFAAFLFVFSLHKSSLVTTLIVIILLTIDCHVGDAMTRYRIFQTSLSFFAGNFLNIYHASLRKVPWIFPALVVVACQTGWVDGLGVANLPLLMGATILLAICLPQGKLRLPDLSYGIYIWHAPVMIALLHPIGMDRNARWVTAAVLVTIGCAALSWCFVEKPILRFKGQGRGTEGKHQ